MKQDFGGTLLGFVAGIVVGLGLALGVAVYVTKVPVPFVDRGVSRNAMQDAIETERNRNWNPNAALSGGPANAPRPAGPAGADGPAIVAPGTNPPGGASSGTIALPAPPAPASPQAPAASSDPLGDLARARTQSGSSAVPTVTASDPFVYFVQAGAFRTQADAESQRARLAMLGFDARVSEREQSGQTVYRVRMGPFNARTDADSTHQRLAGNGVEAALVRVQR